MTSRNGEAVGTGVAVGLGMAGDVAVFSVDGVLGTTGVGIGVGAGADGVRAGAVLELGAGVCAGGILTVTQPDNKKAERKIQTKVTNKLFWLRSKVLNLDIHYLNKAPRINCESILPLEGKNVNMASMVGLRNEFAGFDFL